MAQIQFAYKMFDRLLRDFLKREHWSLDAFAKDVGVTRQTVYNWINGERVPPIKRIGKIAEVLKCKPESLLKGLRDVRTNHNQ